MPELTSARKTRTSSALDALQRKFASHKVTPVGVKGGLAPHRLQPRLTEHARFLALRILSFDCYGTLIDWESGILGYLRPLLRSKGLSRSPTARFSISIPSSNRASSSRRTDVIVKFWPRCARFCARISVSNSAIEDANGLADSIRSWEPFPDTVPALKRLKSRYKLAVLSNIDDDLFAFTAPKLGVELDCVVTAQQVQSYKPSLRNFETFWIGWASKRAPAACRGEPLSRCRYRLTHWGLRPSGSIGVRADPQPPPDWSRPIPISKCRRSPLWLIWQSTNSIVARNAIS